MKTIFSYSDENRNRIWDELSECEYTLKNLKSIVQNEGELSSDNLDEWLQIKNNLFQKLDEIQQDLKSKYDYIRTE